MSEYTTKVYEENKRLAAENAALKADAERYRWLFGAYTKEQAEDADIGLAKPAPQDILLYDLAGFYFHKDYADAVIDAAMKETP